jgi:hypothetical protein
VTVCFFLKKVWKTGCDKMSINKRPLVDQGNRERKGVKKKCKTTKGHFENYLEYEGSDYNNLDDIPEDWFTEEKFGKYSDYLFNTVTTINKFNTHDQYLSSLYNTVTKKYRKLKLSLEDYYTTLRKNVKNDWKERCFQRKETLQDHTVCGTKEDIEYFALKAFEEGYNGAVKRSIIATDTTGIGRISECSRFSYKDFKLKKRLNEHAIFINWFRSKTSTWDNLVVYCNIDGCWASCPLHAWGTQLGIMDHVSEEMFFGYEGEAGGTKMNTMYNEYSEQWLSDSNPYKRPEELTAKFKNHSIRATAINICRSTPGIDEDYVDNRAGFALDKVKTQQVYFRGNYFTDNCCALALAGKQL